MEGKEVELKLFLKDLRENIKKRIGVKELDAPLSEEKIRIFFDNSKYIVEQSFKKFEPFINSLKSGAQTSDLELTIQGEQNLMSKSAFTDEVEHLNYESIFAELIAKNNIEYYFPNSFFIARTRRYLLNRENINEGLERALSGNSNAIIIGLRLNYDLEKNVQKKHSFINMPCFLPEIQDVFFVLDKSDLPSLEFTALSEEEIKEFQLQLINENIRLYSSVIDINKSQNSYLKEKINSKNESGDLQVLITIAFRAILRWSEKRDIIQINVANQYREEGLQNNVNDIEPLWKKK